MFKIILISTLILIPTATYAQSASSVTGQPSFQDKLKEISKDSQTSITNPYDIHIANNKKLHEVHTINNISGFNNTPGSMVNQGITTPGSNHVISNIKTDISGSTKINNDTNIGQDFLNNPPAIATINNQNQINYHSCLRVMINNGHSVKQALTQCHKANPNVHDDEEFIQPQKMPNKLNMHDNQISGSIDGMPPLNDEDHQIILPGSSGSGLPVNMNHKNVLRDINNNMNTEYISPSPVTMAPLGNIDCDVSKDIRVLLSSKCMNETDKNMAGGIGNPVPFVEDHKNNTVMTHSNATNTDKMLCEFTFIPTNGSDTKQSSFHPKTAMDCLKKALSLSYSIAGRTNIVMTLPDGTVSSATCTTNQLGRQSCSTN